MNREAEYVIETLIRAAREGLHVTALRLKTPEFLRVAHGFDVCQPNERPRPGMPKLFVGFADPFEMNAHMRKNGGPFLVQVGKSFQIAGPNGMVTIEEES